MTKWETPASAPEALPPDLTPEDVKHILRTTPGPDGYREGLVRAGFAWGRETALAAPSTPAAPTQCACGVPWTLGVVHRPMHPCFVYIEPADQSTPAAQMDPQRPGWVQCPECLAGMPLKDLLGAQAAPSTPAAEPINCAICSTPTLCNANGCADSALAATQAHFSAPGLREEIAPINDNKGKRSRLYTQAQMDAQAPDHEPRTGRLNSDYLKGLEDGKQILRPGDLEMQAFLDAAAGEGLVLAGIDAADLYVSRYGYNPPGAAPCTCHPDDRPQVCRRKFALSDCWEADRSAPAPPDLDALDMTRLRNGDRRMLNPENQPVADALTAARAAS